MSKIALIGPENNIRGLEALGLTVLSAENSSQARKHLEKLDEDHKVIFITERLAAGLLKEISELNKKPGISVTLIPDSRGITGLIIDRMQFLVKKAVGAEVFIR